MIEKVTGFEKALFPKTNRTQLDEKDDGFAKELAALKETEENGSGCCQDNNSQNQTDPSSTKATSSEA